MANKCRFLAGKIRHPDRPALSLQGDPSVSFMSLDEAIEYLKISKPTFLKYVHLGRIKAIKAGKGVREA
jgi:excisionase family DNA binding protein